MKKSYLRQLIKEEVQSTLSKLDEIKGYQISQGDSYTLSSDIGKFKAGDNVEVISIKPFGNDIEIELSNGSTTDKFYMDRNDEFDELNEEEETDEDPVDADTPESPSGDITKQEAKELIKNTKGKFFTVAFIKKDGSRRVMNARLGVKIYLKGGELPYDAESKGLLPVYDMQKKEYRMININTITDLKIGTNIYKVK